MYSISKAINDVIRISRIMQHMLQPIKTLKPFIFYCINSIEFNRCLTIKSDRIITSKSNTAETIDCERFAMSFQVLRYAFLFQVDLEDIVDIAIIT